MWLTTTRGFYSAVEHRDDPRLILVRARVQADLERLREVLPRRERQALIVPTLFDADYPYRIVITRKAWTHALTRLADEVDYPNFKSACPHDRSDALMAAWSAYFKLEQLDPGVRAVERGRGWPLEPITERVVSTAGFGNWIPNDDVPF